MGCGCNKKNQEVKARQYPIPPQRRQQIPEHRNTLPKTEPKN